MINITQNIISYSYSDPAHQEIGFGDCTSHFDLVMLLSSLHTEPSGTVVSVSIFD